jgi:hypothetical protein
VIYIFFFFQKLGAGVKKHIYVNYNKEKNCVQEKNGEFCFFPMVYCLGSSHVINVISPLSSMLNSCTGFCFSGLKKLEGDRTHSELYTEHSFSFL